MKTPKDFMGLAIGHCDRACSMSSRCTGCRSLADDLSNLWNKAWEDGYNTGYEVGYQQAAGDEANAANP